MRTVFYTNLSVLNVPDMTAALKPEDKFLNSSPYKAMRALEAGDKTESDITDEERARKLYKYRLTSDAAGDSEPVYGIQTNEAALKSVLNQGPIEELILIASESVYDNSRYSKDLNRQKNKGMVRVKLDGRRDASGDWQGTLDYFLTEVRDYLVATFKEGTDRVRFVDVYPIDDSPQHDDMTNCAISVARKIIAIQDKCGKSAERLRLVLDSNGGKRDFIIIQLGIIRALEVQGIKPDQILYSDFNPKAKKWADQPIEIRNNQKSYDIFDVVSGIDEFIKYGRVYKLREYFADPSCINPVLDSVNRMSEAVTTCFTDFIVDSVMEAAIAIQQFTEDGRAQSRLEKQVVEQIREDMGEDLVQAAADTAHKDRIILPLIQWCYRKKFYQQAITLYVDKMPAWYVAEGILTPKVEGKSIVSAGEFYKNLYPSRFLVTGHADSPDPVTIFQTGINDIKERVSLAPDSRKRSTAVDLLRRLEQDPELNLDAARVEDKIDTIIKSYRENGTRKGSNGQPANLERYFDHLFNTGYGSLVSDEAMQSDQDDLEKVYKEKLEILLNIPDEFAEAAVRIGDVDRKAVLRKIMEYYLAFKICRNNSNHSNGRCGAKVRAVCLTLEEEGIVDLSNTSIGSASITLDYAFMDSLLGNALAFHRDLKRQNGE